MAGYEWDMTLRDGNDERGKEQGEGSVILVIGDDYRVSNGLTITLSLATS